ncbi:MAG: leucyl/phenylalanyl-tRNA--protein transferase [Planctomycetota bacterium]
MSFEPHPVDPEILANLSPEILLSAYAQGLFPMVEAGELYWFSPDPRGILPLDGRFHVPRRLKRTLRSGRFVCTIDSCFQRVIRLCRTEGTGRENGTWISPEMRSAYVRLHEMGFAHSFEAWSADAPRRGDPIGGLYGVAMGRAFFAESMFHTVTDAGKAALVASVMHLRECGFTLYDLQWVTPNLARYGAVEIPQQEYRQMLAEAIADLLDPGEPEG